MKMSPSKLKVMCITHKSRKGKLDIKINGIPIEEVEKNVFLGIMYDKKFTFEAHTEVIRSKLDDRIRAMRTLKAATWGPTQSTMLVLHNSFVTATIREGMMAWYPFIDMSTTKALEAKINESSRIITGLPRNTPVQILKMEAGTDSVDQLAHKSATSLYAQINPYHPDSRLMIKNRYRTKLPDWAEFYLHPDIGMEWNEQIQSTKNKSFLTADNVTLHLGSLTTQEETEKVEDKYEYILYTDASVDPDNTIEPQGRAAIGYAWYKTEANSARKLLMEKSANIGHRHTSFSAEAIALVEAFKNTPTEIENEHKIGVFTDSLSNILNLERGVVTATEQRDLVEILNEKTNKIDFHHTKSHIGITRNEHVDKLCSLNNATPEREQRIRNGEITKVQIKEKLKSRIIRERKENLQVKMRKEEKLYKNNKRKDPPTETYYWNLLGDLESPPREHTELARKESTLLSKARANRWTSCRRFLHRIGESQVDLCDTCPNKRDTTKHQLNVCPDHEEDREILKAKLGYKYANITDMLFTVDKKELTYLCKFLILVDERNTERLKKGDKVVYSLALGKMITLPH